MMSNQKFKIKAEEILQHLEAEYQKEAQTNFTNDQTSYYEINRDIEYLLYAFNPDLPLLKDFQTFRRDKTLTYGIIRKECFEQSKQFLLYFLEYLEEYCDIS